MVELCAACNRKIVGIVDNQLSGGFCGFDVLGTDRDVRAIYRDYKDVQVVVNVEAPLTRKNLVEHYSQAGFEFSGLIHPAASVSRSARIGKGVVIESGVNISANVTIGDFVFVNLCANVTHDVAVGSYTTVAPNAVVLGRVLIDAESYIGSNSTILPDLRIHRGAIVGAGSVVTTHVKPGKIVVGNPAKEISKVRELR